MFSSAVARVKNNGQRFTVVALFSCLVSLCGTSGLAQAQAGSLVGATVCAGSSTITLASPVSDSVVTTPVVPFSGSVTQAGQVEVRVDGVFDSSIQLTVGQTSYSSSVQLSPGTHTLEVTAISVCPGGNGVASSVVTYEAPPQIPSTGGSTPTNVGGASTGGGVTVGGVRGASGQGVTEQDNGWLPPLLAKPLTLLGQWLNINQNDYARADPVQSMGVIRAITFGVGVYLLILGMAPLFAAPLAKLPILASHIPGGSLALRIRWLHRAGRPLGLLLILATVLL